ncbi:vWA domain-containing protein [Acaryochloris marina]|uniref:von Willebrand factor, type A domain protein n=1 Tax=Acaryochloris marina (strain MBIC 11017) TaxID=329726 RepID=B0CCM8_ACAM1|nr:VWA domain-containing protein [Acaryochloris marina]ABW29190.1 von Willebrand factor, type A domain protein [Acaryochloris marina MBIC11017]
MKQFNWQRSGALSAALLMTMSACQPLNIAQAKSQPQTRIKGCNSESLLLPAHKDVEVLRNLYEQYLGRTPVEIELGLSRAEFAQSLAQLTRSLERLQDKSLSSVDAALLKRLQQDYATELSQVRQRRKPSNRRFGISPRRPRPTGLPPALTKAQPAPAETAAQSQFSRDQSGRMKSVAPPAGLAPPAPEPRFQDKDRLHLPGTFNTEDYKRINENPFFLPQRTPLSTFSIDVDTASYSNVRRFIRQGQLPPKDAVRLEELINYFDYGYASPKGDQPFSVSTEVATAPWNNQHKLVHIGLKGKELEKEQPSNLVFLIDVSGSMKRPNKLALVKKSLCLLVHQLKPEDRVSLVVYAGRAGIVLPSTPGTQKATIMNAIDRLEAGGSTAGAAGIKMAYDMAERHFLKNGNNRVILATDGDFNVGQSSDAELERLIEQKRDRGVFLTVLGYGTGNYKDNKMELLANKGNGNYAYIDTLLEAQKVLVNDLRGTLFTIAKDVKIQVEFNPGKVQAYRLIGYENRLLRDQDFNDDRKDAGEIGSGHTITALYEVIPTGVKSDVELPDIDPLKFQKPTASSNSSDLMNLKLRYKQPTGSKSQLISTAIADKNRSIQSATDNLKFSAAVAMYGMVLRDSDYKGKATFNQVLDLADQAKGKDPQGYRMAFMQLVERSQTLQQAKARTEKPKAQLSP